MKKSRPYLWLQASCSLLLVFIAAASQAAAPDALLDPLHHAAERPANDAIPVLSLDDAVRLSQVDQPILSGHEAVINANERQAVSAAQLPDPKLSGGLKELPVDTSVAHGTYGADSSASNSRAVDIRISMPALFDVPRI
jgi:hypothetical protein